MNLDRSIEKLFWLERALGGIGLRSIAHLTREAVVSLWRSRVVSLFAVGIIALSLATVGSFLIVTQNLERILERFHNIEFSLYIADDATREELAEVNTVLANTPSVVSSRYVSKDEALAIFKKTHPSLAAVPSSLGSNPFPASYEVRLTEELGDPQAIEELAGQLTNLAAVDSVGLDHELVRRLGSARSVVHAVGFFFGGILAFASLFTVANVVKLTAYAHRDEIEIMKLVGATNAFVRGTYIIEGMLQGLCGGVVGVAVLYAGYSAATSYLTSSSLVFLQSLTSSFLATGATATLIAAATLTGMLGAALSLGRYVRL